MSFRNGGRRWHSPKGNLYATFGFRPGVGASTGTQLSFAAGLAAYDAIAACLPAGRLKGLKLKWPNDVLLDGAKIAGILIESVTGPGGTALAMAIGTGINVGAPPVDTGPPVTGLGLGADACPGVFAVFAGAFELWLDLWDKGRGFPGIREAWLARAHTPGELLSVCLNECPVQGRFHGLDASGALQIEAAGGIVITVNAGDVYPAAHGRGVGCRCRVSLKCIAIIGEKLC